MRFVIMNNPSFFFGDNKMKKLLTVCVAAFLGLPIVCLAQAPESNLNGDDSRPAVDRPRDRDPGDRFDSRDFRGPQGRRDMAPPREGDRRFPGPGPRPELKFDMFDANQDGVIDKEEFKKLQEMFMRPPMPPREGQPWGDRGPKDRGPKENGPRGDRPQFDGDRPQFDGDRPQFDGNRPQFDGDRPQFDGDRPAGDRPAGDRPNPNNFFKRLDVNQNGVIEKEEIPPRNERFLELFEKLDVNKDGKVESSEWKALQSREGRPGRGGNVQREGDGARQ